MTEAMQPLFPLGQIVMTPGAIALLNEYHVSRDSLLHRHMTGDWGELPAEDVAENERSVREGFPIFSSYHVCDSRHEDGFADHAIWIITEADRSSTTILLPVGD
jgi:hypothetical protein